MIQPIVAGGVVAALFTLLFSLLGVPARADSADAALAVCALHVNAHKNLMKGPHQPPFEPGWEDCVVAARTRVVTPALSAKIAGG